jgi:hypothetical protein
MKLTQGRERFRSEAADSNNLFIVGKNSKGNFLPNSLFMIPYAGIFHHNQIPNLTLAITLLVRKGKKGMKRLNVGSNFVPLFPTPNVCEEALKNGIHPECHFRVAERFETRSVELMRPFDFVFWALCKLIGMDKESREFGQGDLKRKLPRNSPVRRFRRARKMWNDGNESDVIAEFGKDVDFRRSLAEQLRGLEAEASNVRALRDLEFLKAEITALAWIAMESMAGELKDERNETESVLKRIGSSLSLMAEKTKWLGARVEEMKSRSNGGPSSRLMDQTTSACADLAAVGLDGVRERLSLGSKALIPADGASLTNGAILALLTLPLEEIENEKTFESPPFSKKRPSKLKSSGASAWSSFTFLGSDSSSVDSTADADSGSSQTG